MADALGMRVIGFDPFAKNLPTYVQAADLETIWRELMQCLCTAR